MNKPKREKNQLKNCMIKNTLIALLIASGTALGLSPPLPNKNISDHAYGYITKINLQKDSSQKMTSHMARYFFSAQNNSYTQKCRWSIKFLNKNKITSPGQGLLIEEDLDACSDLYGLKNQKVYKAIYYNFTKNQDLISEQAFDVQVSFTDANYTSGNYSNLVIKSVDPGMPGFELKQEIVRKFLDHDTINQFISISLSMLVVFSILPNFYKSSHFSIDFCYKFAKFWVIFTTYDLGMSLYAASNIVVFTCFASFRYIKGPFFSLVSLRCDFSLKEFIALTKKYIIWAVLSIVLSFVGLEFLELYPYLSFLPSLMWLVDLKTSPSTQKFKSFFMEEFCFILVMATTFYLPSSFTGTNFNLMIGCNYVQVGLFTLFAVVVFPSILWIFTRSKKSDILTQIQDYELEGVVVHGDGKKNPRAILKGLSDQEILGQKMYGLEIPSYFTGRKLSIYRPYLTLGILELHTKTQSVEGNLYSKGTEFIDFFNYQKNKINWFNTHKTSKSKNLKSTYRFQVCSQQYAKQLRYGIKLLDVEMDESVNQNKLISIHYSTKQVIFQPRFRKVIKRYSFLALAKDQVMVNPCGNRFSIHTFISGGRLYSMLAERNNLNPLTRTGNAPTGQRNRVGFSNNFRVAFLENQSIDLDLNDLEPSRFSSKYSGMQLYRLRAFDGMVLLIFKIEDDYSVMLYQLEEVALRRKDRRRNTDDEDEDVVLDGEDVGEEERDLNVDQFGLELDENDPEHFRKVPRLKRICELDRRAFENRILCDAFFVNKDLIGLVTNRDIIICKFFGLDEGRVNIEMGYWMMEVSSFNPGHTYRKVCFNKSRGELHCISGTEGGFFLLKRVISVSSVIVLKPLLDDLARFETNELLVQAKFGKVEDLMTIGASSMKSSELQEKLYSHETETSNGDDFNL